MNIYAIDRIGEAVYTWYEGSYSYPSLTIHQSVYTIKISPLSVYTELTPTRFAYARQKSRCCNMKVSC